MRMLLHAGCALAFASAAVAQVAEAPLALGDLLERDELVREVLLRHPRLEAAAAASRAAAERVTGARGLAQPRATYALAPFTIGEGRVGQELTLTQPLPYSRVRALRSALASTELEASRLGEQELALDLALEASWLFDDYWLVERAIAINGEHLELLAEFRSIATARYASGEASQADPIQAEVEQAHLHHREMRLSAERSAILARINGLLERAPAEPLPPPAADRTLPPLEPVDLERVLEAALATRPEIARAEAEIRARRRGQELARTASRPGLEAMASYSSMWDEPEHRFMAGIGIELPLWRKTVRSAIGEAGAEVERAEAERRALVDAVRVEVHTAWELLEESHHVAELYRSRLLPASRDQVQAALSAFRSGQSSFLALIDAERNQRTVELAYFETLAEISRRRAQLDRAAGRVPAGVR